jgi:hypothetical protein
MSNGILKLKDLRQALRKSAGDFCDLAELNEGTTDPKPSSAKRKTVKRQTVFKSENWYERAASSISAAPRG